MLYFVLYEEKELLPRMLLHRLPSMIGDQIYSQAFYLPTQPTLNHPSNPKPKASFEVGSFASRTIMTLNT